MTTEAKKRRERVVHSAREKAEAVLASWTERRRPSEICRELGITGTLLGQWQERAMEGILTALEPRTRSAEELQPALPAKVERLLTRKIASGPLNRLSKRLTALQQNKDSGKAVPTVGANR